MAKQLDQVEQQEAPAQEEGVSQDLEIVVRLGVKVLNEGGLDQIKTALKQSKDPAQVVGTFLVQIIAHISENLSKKIDLDPNVFLSKGGFLDYMLDYIEKKLGLPAEFSDQVYGSVLETVKAAAMAEQGGGQPQQAPAPQGPALDQPAPGGM